MAYDREDHQRNRPRYDSQQRPGGRDDDRSFIDRAGDEVRSWFGDEEAEQRRERDDREAGYRGQGGNRSESSGGSGAGGQQDYSRQRGASAARHGQHHDPHYQEWRQRQIDQLDRDYHEYRAQNQSKFESEFGSWRTQRQSQRSLLDRVDEHMEVCGSDGQHLGKVDKVRGDRIVLAKNDPAAGGHHHSIPSSWVQSVDGDRVTLMKSTEEAKRAWRDEDRNNAMFGSQDGPSTDGPHILDRSFSGTY